MGKKVQIMELRPELLSEIDTWITENQADLIADILDAVRIRSVVESPTPGHPYGDGCAAMLDHFCALSQRYGFSVQNYDYHCASGLLKGAGGAGEIGIWSHTDVVPEGEGWTYAPYDPVVKDGYIIGRGANDNKGPAIAALYAMRFLRERGKALRHDVKLFFGSSEETGMSDIVYYGQNYSFSDFSLVPDAWFPVCIAEKGILRLAVSCPVEAGPLMAFTGGSASNIVPNRAQAVLSNLSPSAAKELAEFDGIEVQHNCELTVVTACGIGKHAARPEGSINAAARLAHALLTYVTFPPSMTSALETLFSTCTDYYGAGLGYSWEDKCSGKLTHILGLAALKGGRLNLDYNIRYPVTADRTAMLAAFRQTLAHGGFMLERLEDDPPTGLHPENPVVKLLCNTVDEVLGTSSEPYSMGGGTYARKLPYAVAFGPHRFDCPCTLFPTGRGDAHQPDECINIQLLLDAVKIYILSLLRLDQAL